MTQPAQPVCRNDGLDFYAHRITSKDPAACDDFNCVPGTHIPEMGGSTGYCSVCGHRVDQ